jgi:two-component system, OmpR family, phosphate regulon sensor histidine kinase PhoR
VTASSSSRLLWIGISTALILLIVCIVAQQSLLAAAFALAGVLGITLWARTQAQNLEEDLYAAQTKFDQLNRLSESQKATIDAFADGLELGIFVCDHRAQIQYANRFAREMFGFDNLAGRTILSATLSVELEQLALKCDENQGNPLSGEITINFPRERVCQVTAWTVNDSDRRIYLSLQDITELRRLERIRKDFVANVSHELRTPMTVIRAYAETMQDNDDRKLTEKYLDRIIQEVDRLSNITQDLLVLSTAESNLVRKAPCDLGEIVQYCFNMLLPKAEAKGLSLAYSGPQNLQIEANANQVTQVVMNLLENSIKYTSEGGIEISLEEENGTARLDIADTGIGIAAEHIERLFERFYRVDKGRSRASGGTGLGLSIVKHIVEAHGGNIQVESTLNQGSTFTVFIPCGEPVKPNLATAEFSS